MVQDIYNGKLGLSALNTWEGYIFSAALNQWLQRPQLTEHYNKREFMFYDSLIWTVIENLQQREKELMYKVKEEEK